MLFLMSFISNYIDEPQNALQFNICQDTHYVTHGQNLYNKTTAKEK